VKVSASDSPYPSRNGRQRYKQRAERELDVLVSAGTADGNLRDQLGPAERAQRVETVCRTAPRGEVLRLRRAVRADAPDDAGKTGRDRNRRCDSSHLQRTNRPADTLGHRNRPLERLQRSRAERQGQAGELGAELTARRAALQVRREPRRLELRQRAVELQRDELAGSAAMETRLSQRSHTKSDGTNVP
jgi:hypothetical protein